MTPREVAIQQLTAYNNHDLDAFCLLFDDNATLIDLPTSTVIADGIEEIKTLYEDRFSQPKLRCTVHSTSDIGDFAIDRETVYGLAEGPVNIVAMYEVKHNKIQRVYFIRDK